MKFDQTLMNVVRHDLDNGLIPMLLGEPGIGKSSWTIALGEVMRTKVFVLACNQLADKADLTGARLVPIYEPVLDANGNPTGEQIIADYEQVFYPHSVINQAIKYATEHPRETPILFMDELNRTTPDVTSEALSIPTLRSIGNKKLPNNLRVVTAGNDKGNIVSLDEASISRFALYHVEPDVGTFLGLDSNLNPFVRKVLENHPETIFCKAIKVAAGTDTDDDDNEVDINEILEDEGEMNQIATPRTISGVSKWLNSYNNQELMTMCADIHTVNGEDKSTLQEVLEGHTGKTAFTQFLIAEIASGIQNTNNQANAIQVNKPNIYDRMKQCPDITALNDMISNMDDNEKSGCLLYALYEKEDNTVYITALASAITALIPQDTTLLMKCSMNDMLDEDNKQSLLNTGTTLAQTLSVILNV